jgi:hypothetical protein
VAWPNQSPPGSNPSSTPEFTPPAIVALASGIIMFLASIGGWVTFEILDEKTSLSPWTSRFGLFPVALFVPLAGLVTAAIVAIRLFAKDKVPSDIAGFSLLQIQQVLAVFTLLLALGYLIMDKEGASLGFGYWLNLLGAIGLVAAAVMEYLASKKPAGSFGGGGGQGFGAPQQSFPPPGAQQYPQQPQGQQYPQQPQGQQYPQQPQGQPYPPQQQQPRPPQQQQQPPRQQPPAGQGYPPPPPPQGGNWPQQ